MAFTVRLCRDLTGWFATLGDDVIGYPGASVHWETAFENPSHPMSVLDLAETLAQRLVDDRSSPGQEAEAASHSEANERPPQHAPPSISAASVVSHHREGGRALVLVQVNHDKYGHGLRIRDSHLRSEAAIYYPSRQMALDVADALVRIRYRTHVCDVACSGWTVEAADLRPLL
jgi:hypothetical protein